MKTDNGLIAEFMEMVPNPHDGNQTWSFKEDAHSVEGQIYGVWHPLQYETSWDWLMPVVEKIATYVYDSYESSNGYKNITEHDRAYTRTFGMIDGQGKWMVRINRMPLEQEDTLIKATYQAVVEFIKWYNTQPKETTSQQQAQSE